MIGRLTLHLTLDFERGILNAEINEDLKGEASTFLLNKGLGVKECSTKFSQKIGAVRNFKGFKANVVELKKPVSKVEFIYSGRLGDYRDVLQYLKDSISRDYTLLRTDSLFYPIPAEPTFEDLVKSVVSSEFEARITVDGVPDDLEIAFGGEIRGNQLKISGVNRLDIAVAPFEVIEETPFRLFVLSIEGIERTLELARRAYDFYSSLLGRRGGTYTIIETPEDYGGQAGKGYMLVSGSALRAEVPAGVYHELAHLWNPRAEPEAHLSRFFDEAFANYLTALAIGEIHGREAFERFIRNALEEPYQRLLAQNPEIEALKVPEWGRRGLGMLSYTKGALILKELHEAMGDSFYELLRRSVEAEKMDFKLFKQLVEELGGKKAGEIFNKYFGV